MNDDARSLRTRYRRSRTLSRQESRGRERVADVWDDRIALRRLLVGPEGWEAASPRRPRHVGAVSPFLSGAVPDAEPHRHQTLPPEMGTTIALCLILRTQQCSAHVPEWARLSLTSHPAHPASSASLLRTTLGLTDPAHPDDSRTRTRLTIPRPVITLARRQLYAPSPPLRTDRL